VERENYQFETGSIDPSLDRDSSRDRLVHDASLRRCDGNGKTRCTISSCDFSILVGAAVATADLHEIVIDIARDVIDINDITRKVDDGTSFR